VVHYAHKPPLPVVSSADVIRILEGVGYRRDRQVGSHITLTHPLPDHRNVVVPVRREVGKGLLRAIIRQAGMSVAEFDARWRNL
jgi:predicted RNA binding protein YcfA (HicA-like mRNA interferase family)